jgi:hypothetical protein
MLGLDEAVVDATVADLKRRGIIAASSLHSTDQHSLLSTNMSLKKPRVHVVDKQNSRTDVREKQRRCRLASTRQVVSIEPFLCRAPLNVPHVCMNCPCDFWVLQYIASLKLFFFAQELEHALRCIRSLAVFQMILGSGFNYIKNRGLERPRYPSFFPS